MWNCVYKKSLILFLEDAEQKGMARRRARYSLIWGWGAVMAELQPNLELAKEIRVRFQEYKRIKDYL